MSTTALRQSEGKSSERIHEKVATLLPEEPSLPILDLGCGRGEFLRRLAGRGWTELHGCDGYRFEPDGSLPFGFVQADLNQTLPFDDGSFGAVTAIEVIEHLENPRHLIREISRVLRPGGWAVITTPNNESWLSLLSLGIRGHFSAFADSCYPAHITPVLEVDLRRMLGEQGFEGVEVSFTDSGRIPGTDWHWQALSGTRVFRGKRFSDNLIARAQKPGGP